MRGVLDHERKARPAVTKIIGKEEVREWFRLRGLLGPKPFDTYQGVDYSKLVNVRWFTIPGRATRQTVLGDVLAGFFADDKEVLLCIDGWADSPDFLQDPNLFDRFRQALGETAKVQEKPGQLFYPDDHADMLSLLRLVLHFGWGIHLVSSSGNLLFRVFDFDVGALYAADPAKLDDERLEWLDNVVKEDRETEAEGTQ